MQNINVALANIRLDFDRCCVGMSQSKAAFLNRTDFIQFLRISYKEKSIVLVINRVLFTN